jgi:hypothetical protein
MVLARNVSVCGYGSKGDTMAMAASAARKRVDFDTVHDFVTDRFDADMHARRVYSLANATLGVMTCVSLGVHTIGQALAEARGLTPKHAVKQMDRLLSNGEPARVGAVRALGALCGRRALGYFGGARLDGLCRRRSGDDCAALDNRPWTGDALILG